MPTLDLPENIIRAGEALPWTTKLAKPSRITDVNIPAGFELRGVKVGPKTFGPDFILVGAPEDDKDQPKYALSNYRILPTDSVAFDFVNTSDDDRQFHGTFTYEDAPVLGAPAPAVGSAARPSLASRGPTIPQQGTRKLAVPPPVAAGARTSMTAPRSPGMLVDNLGRGRPSPTSAAATRAVRTLTPGINQVVVLLTRQQANVFERLVRGAYVSPLERQELTAPIKRATGKMTIEEEDGLSTAGLGSADLDELEGASPEAS